MLSEIIPLFNLKFATSKNRITYYSYGNSKFKNPESFRNNYNNNNNFEGCVIIV